MADPFSVSASIAGLVTLADVVFSRIFKYVQAVKGGPKEIATLSSEVGALFGILSNLRLVSSQLEGQAFDSALRTHHINSCAQTLRDLDKILDRDSTISIHNQRMEAMKRKLHWPFTTAEVKTILAEIERHKATLGLALKVDSLSGLLQALSNQEAIRVTVGGIQTELRRREEADTRVAMNTKRQSIMKSFGNLDPGKNQRMSMRLRQPGTGLWFIESQEFRRWSQMENAKLWLYGIPGAGKTVLASTIIEEALCTSDISNAVAFFYCDYKDPATQKAPLILGSLIQQISKQDEQSLEKVEKFCEIRNPGFTENFNYDPQELRDLLRSISLSFDCATVIVDGLDECGVDTTEVTELLKSLNNEAGGNIKTLFLSRNEAEIRACLEDYTQVAIAAKSSDLMLYVGAEIDSRVRKHKLRIKDNSLKEYIMRRLVEEAEGM